MKCNDFDMIKFKMPSTYRNIGTKQKECIALDTETNNGIPFLLADSNKQYSRSKQQIINQLLSTNYNKTINVFYNLGYDKNVILKLLDYESLKYFAKFDYCIDNNIYYGGIGNKSFDVRRTKKINEIIELSNGYKIIYDLGDKLEDKVYKRMPKTYQDIDNNSYVLSKGNKFFDLWQFFKYEQPTSSLNNVSNKYLGSKKIDIASMGYDIENLYFDETILKYCIRDCTLTQELGDMVINACNDTGILFNRPYSCATLAADYFFVHENIKNPTYFLWQYGDFIHGNNKDVFRYAYNCYNGGRAEVVKRGFFGKVYEYDVNSMHPYNMTKLYNVFKCNWFKVFGDEIYNFDWSNMAYGFINCDINLPKDYIHALPLKKKFFIYGYGEHNNYNISIKRLNLLFELGIINKSDVNIKSAWLAEKQDKDEYPFKKTVQHLYNKRKNYFKTDFRNSLYKIILNSIYGRTIEVNINKDLDSDIDLMDVGSYDIMQDDIIQRAYTSGKYFNPIYACDILDQAHNTIFEGIYNKKHSFIASFTDSIISTDKLKHLKISDNLGDWELNKGSLVIIGSGVYRFVDDFNNNQLGLLFPKGKYRTRGLHIKESINDNIFGHVFDDMIKEPYQQKKVLKLKECVIQDKLDDFNTFQNVEKHINLNFDHKRKWNYNFNNINDVYKGVCDSESLCIN